MIPQKMVMTPLGVRWKPLLYRKSIGPFFKQYYKKSCQLTWLVTPENNSGYTKLVCDSGQKK